MQPNDDDGPPTFSGERAVVVCGVAQAAGTEGRDWPAIFFTQRITWCE